MRQSHQPGEKLFVDYAGMTVAYTDKETGVLNQAQIFVAAFGCSNDTYCEATASQALHYFIGSHCRAFTFFGGVPTVLIPDNLKSGVTLAHRYDPLANMTYEELALHDSTTIMPTRARSPKDKAKAENAVLQVERRVLAKLRNHQFFSVAQINEELRPLLTDLNNRSFQKLTGTRRELFETIDKPALKCLPQ